MFRVMFSKNLARYSVLRLFFVCCVLRVICDLFGFWLKCILSELDTITMPTKMVDAACCFREGHLPVALTAWWVKRIAWPKIWAGFGPFHFTMVLPFFSFMVYHFVVAFAINCSRFDFISEGFPPYLYVIAPTLVYKSHFMWNRFLRNINKSNQVESKLAGVKRNGKNSYGANIGLLKKLVNFVRVCNTYWATTAFLPYMGCCNAYRSKVKVIFFWCLDVIDARWVRTFNPQNPKINLLPQQNTFP